MLVLGQLQTRRSGTGPCSAKNPRIFRLYIDDLYTDPAKIREVYVDSVGHEWTTERYSGYGCPCPSLAPGVLGDMGDALQEPFRDVHFVGTEHATKRKGYIGGRFAATIEALQK